MNYYVLLFYYGKMRIGKCLFYFLGIKYKCQDLEIARGLSPTELRSHRVFIIQNDSGCLESCVETGNARPPADNLLDVQPSSKLAVQFLS